MYAKNKGPTHNITYNYPNPQCCTQLSTNAQGNKSDGVKSLLSQLFEKKSNWKQLHSTREKSSSPMKWLTTKLS